jgi:phosphatidate cytidylyltransferase
MTDDAIALRAFHCWLLFPAAALPAHFIARAKGHEGFLGRILLWFVIIPAVLGSSYFGPAALTALLAASCAVACWEIVRLDASGVRPRPKLALAAVVSLPWLLLASSALPSPPVAARLFAMTPALCYPLLPVGARTRWGVPGLALGVGASLSFWLLVRRMPGGFGWVLFAFSVVVVNDMTSFLAGRMLGGWRPFPILSPQKTLAGYGFGALTAVLAGYALSFAIPDLGPVAVGLGALLLVTFGSLGDLFASAVKRRHGAKDSGTCLGPMGGMLDRLDSLLGAGWAFYAFLRLVLG